MSRGRLWRRSRSAKEDDAHPKRWMVWVPIVISVISLAVSGLSAYFSSIRQTDNLQFLIANGVPDVKEHIPISGTMLEIEGPSFQLTFINLGTRPAAIIDATLLIVQPADASRQATCDVGEILE